MILTNRQLEKLKSIQKDGLKPTIIVRDNGDIVVSAEDGKGFADYYGEFTGGYPYIDGALIGFANNTNCYWEWESAGSIILVNK